MDLNEFSPQKVDFKLSFPTLTGDKEFPLTFRPFSLRDDLWYEETFGKPENIQKIFETMDLKQISRMAWHQMAKSSKDMVMKMKTMDINEAGEEVEVSITPIEKMSELIGNGKDILKIIVALVKCRGVNGPLLEAFADEELKKNGTKMGAQERKQLTGLLSLT